MMGFLTSLLEEFWTGKGTLQQIGIATPSQPLTTLLIIVAGGATLAATVQTLVKAQTGKLEPRCDQRNGLCCASVVIVNGDRNLDPALVLGRHIAGCPESLDTCHQRLTTQPIARCDSRIGHCVGWPSLRQMDRSAAEAGCPLRMSS
jgi:hypothetical protein